MRGSRKFQNTCRTRLNATGDLLRTRTVATLLVVGVLGVAALTACGDDSSTASQATSQGAPSSTGASGSPTTGGAPSGVPYKVGIPFRQSGTSASVYQKSVPSTAMSWEKWVNAHGGINGHPVEVVLGDSGGDAAKGLSVVRKMVETDKVVMLHLEDNVIDTAIAAYTPGQKVAVASPWTPYPIWNSTPNWYPLGIANVDFTSASAKVVADAGIKSAGSIVCAEVAACANAIDPFAKALTALGVRADGGVKIAATAPNYTAECLALKAKGTEAIYIGISIDSAARVIKDCATQNYHPRVIMPAAVLDPRVSTLVGPGVDVLSAQTTIPWYADSPILKDFNDAVTQYGDPSTNNMISMYTWTALEFFREAATKAKLGENPTRDEVNKALAADSPTDVGGLAPQVSFAGADQPNPATTKCYFVGGWSGGKFILPNGDKPKCLS